MTIKDGFKLGIGFMMGYNLIHTLGNYYETLTNLILDKLDMPIRMEKNPIYVKITKEETEG